MINTSFWKGRRVLVTGHTGFKGSWLCLWLRSQGARVWGYSLPSDSSNILFNDLDLGGISSKSFSGTLHSTYGNILDLDSLSRTVAQAQPEIVFHLAAQSLVRLSYREPLLTWSTNVQGSLQLLEALRSLDHICSVVMVTTDKVYLNKEWPYGYRESDELGGFDPYSSSKAAAEIGIDSWRLSFCSAGSRLSHLRVATARAGNVIGGGDWALDRIIPDCIKALRNDDPILVRNPLSTRPWQHVLEPLSGYLRLAEVLHTSQNPPCEAFNFGPYTTNNCSVEDLVKLILNYWPGHYKIEPELDAPHEAKLLNLQIEKSMHLLNWRPIWDLKTTVKRTIGWYRCYDEGHTALDCCLDDLNEFQDLSRT